MDLVNDTTESNEAWSLPYPASERVDSSRRQLLVSAHDALADSEIDKRSTGVWRAIRVTPSNVSVSRVNCFRTFTSDSLAPDDESCHGVVPRDDKLLNAQHRDANDSITIILKTPICKLTNFVSTSDVRCISRSDNYYTFIAIEMKNCDIIILFSNFFYILSDPVFFSYFSDTNASGVPVIVQLSKIAT